MTAKENIAITEIDRKEVMIEDLVATYKLVKIMDAYLVSVSLDGDSAAAFAGYEVSLAEEIFATLVNGAVTPCTARDVCRDLLLQKSLKLFTNM